MNAYEWNADDYERNSKGQQKWARELIEKLELKGRENILDLGCGDGKVTAEIANRVKHGSVIGVDNSEAMIKLANKKYSPGTYKNLSFVVMDASNLSFKKSFDVVFSNAALHWVKDHRPVIKGLFNCLKPGGRILLQMGGKGNASGIFSVLEEIINSYEWKQYFENFEFPYSFLGTEEYKKLLNNAGFTIKRIELIPKDMMHFGKSELEGWIRTTWLPYLKQIPKEKQEKFIDTLSTKYIQKEPVDSKGIVHVAMVRLEVEAQK